MPRRGGWHGAALWIDVGAGEATRRAIPPDVLEAFVGGVGLGAWLCLEAGGADTRDAFAPEAPIVFASSPLVGTALATSAKLAVVGRSPLTGLLCDGLTSSDFAIALKRCGVDALVVTGAASALCEVVIDDQSVRYESAADWAGRPAAECRRPGFETAAIGVAGERCVRFANLSNGGRHAGRGGLGAVLGAKRVKAISLRGSRPTPVFDARAVAAHARALAERSLGPETAKYRELGTVANLETFDRLGVLPRRNFLELRAGAAASGPTTAASPPSAAIEAPASAAASASPAPVGWGVSIERRSCAACRIGCEHRFESAPGSGDGVRLEYETAWALGPLLGVEDRASVIAAARECDALGLDTISAGGTLALAMEAGSADADGGARFDFGFGDGHRLPELLRDIALRRGVGDLLAEGARRVGLAIGRPDAAMHVKGLELPGYDPRKLQAMALGLAIGTRGADHNRSGAYELDFSTRLDREALRCDDVPLVVHVENRTAALDSLVLCKFLRGAFDEPEREWSELLHAVTGARVDVARLGARVCVLRRLFNQRAGWRPELDALPARLVAGSLEGGGFERCVARYYRERACSTRGFVTQGTLRSVGLERLWDEARDGGAEVAREAGPHGDADVAREPSPRSGVSTAREDAPSVHGKVALAGVIP